MSLPSARGTRPRPAHPHAARCEIEAGRGTQGNAIYRDLIQTSLLIDVRFLALAVLIEYRFKSGAKTITSTVYRKTISLLDATYASDKLRLPLDESYDGPTCSCCVKAAADPHRFSAGPRQAG